MSSGGTRFTTFWPWKTIASVASPASNCNGFMSASAAAIPSSGGRFSSDDAEAHERGAEGRHGERAAAEVSVGAGSGLIDQAMQSLNR